MKTIIRWIDVNGNITAEALQIGDKMPERPNTYEPVQIDPGEKVLYIEVVDTGKK